MSYNSAYLSGPIYFGGKGGPSIWIYDDTAAVASVIASGYISDGFKRGMEQGDFLIYRKFAALVGKTTPTMSFHCVTVVTDAENTTLSAAIGDTSGLTVPVTSSTATPAATDDFGDGYLKGSLWVETDVGEVYANTDNTTNAAVWKPLTDHFTVDRNLGLASAVTATFITTHGIVIPVPAKLIKAWAVVEGATLSAAATTTLTLSRNATAITNGAVTIAQATTTGVVNSATPTALNTFAAGDVLNIAIATTSTTLAVASFTAYFERLSA